MENPRVPLADRIDLITPATPEGAATVEMGVRPTRATETVATPRSGGYGITAYDFRGLTPEDVTRHTSLINQIDATTENIEQNLIAERGAAALLEARRLENLMRREDARNKLMFDSKADAARAVAESNLTGEKQSEWMDRITKASSLEDVLKLKVDALGLPKRVVSGIERDAVASEMFNGRNYSQLTKKEKEDVNALMTDRYFVVVNDQGIWVVDKRTRTIRKAAPGQNEQQQPATGTVAPVAPVEPGETRRPTQTRPTVRTGREPMLEDFRNMPADTARLLYEEFVAGNLPPEVLRARYNELIQVYPELKDVVKMPEAGATTTPQPDLVGAYRTLTRDEALQLYRSVERSNPTPRELRVNYDAIMQAYPELKDQIKAPAGPRSELVPTERTVLSDIESLVGEPVRAGERYAQAGDPMTQLPGASVYRPAAGITPTVGIMEDVRINENVNTFRERVKGLGRERAIELYSGVLETIPSKDVQIAYRDALVRAWPDLASKLRDPAMLVGRVTEPRTPGAAPPPRLTEAQERAYNYGIRAVNANNIINNLESRGQYGRGVILSPAERFSRLTPEQARAYARSVGGVVGLVVGGILGAVALRSGRPINLPARWTGTTGGVGEPVALPGGSLVGTLLGSGVGAVAGGFVGDPLLGGAVTLLAEDVANMARDENDRSYLQGKLDFISAILRKESGATITAEYCAESTGA
jgi:hypothetical protein